MRRLRESRARRIASAVVALSALALAAAAASTQAAHVAGFDTTGHTTLEQTICGGDFAEVLLRCGDPQTGFKTLTLGPADVDPATGGHVVRNDLEAEPRPRRERRRRSLSYFGQITDFQLADEESPAREERTDSDPLRRGLGSSGFRPHEAMVVHMVELSIRQLNRHLSSPVRQGNGTSARLQSAVMTGDLADNMQLNETEWVFRLLEGTTDTNELLDPSSGTADFEGTLCRGLPPEAVADGTNPRNYTGVQDYDDYLLDNPLYWDPDVPLGAYKSRGWPVYPGLLDRAQEPFEAEGLAVPSYVAFGNHDGLYQGTVSAASPLGPGTHVPPFERVATDCLKLVYPFTDQDAFPSLVTPESLQQLLQSDPRKVMQVPPDARRRFVNHRQFKEIFARSEKRDGSGIEHHHGFAHVDRDELEASDGVAAYYAFRPDPRRAVRFIVLDTLADAGVLVTPSGEGGFAAGSEGNIDDPQFRWLEDELDAAEQANELVIVFGHHATASLTVSAPDELAPCTVDDSHGHDVNPSCDEDPRNSSPVHLGSDLRRLFLEHPNVIAYVAGHSHENAIQGFRAADGNSGFWEIKSPAVADWPPQHRLIEVMDNRDGTLSIFTTNLDHEGSTQIPPPGTPAATFDQATLVETLGSIGRTVEYNDPHAGPSAGNIGEAEDRNTELLVPDPRPERGQGRGRPRR